MGALTEEPLSFPAHGEVGEGEGDYGETLLSHDFHSKVGQENMNVCRTPSPRKHLSFTVIKQQHLTYQSVLCVRDKKLQV